MASRKRPEQRSTAADRAAGQPAAHPTGEESFSTGSETAGRDHHPERTAEEQAELRELERTVAESYEQLGQLADRLTDRAAEAYRIGRSFVRENPRGTLASSFAVGVVLAVLISRT